MRAEALAHHALERRAVVADERDLAHARRVEVDRLQQVAERRRVLGRDRVQQAGARRRGVLVARLAGQPRPAAGGRTRPPRSRTGSACPRGPCGARSAPRGRRRWRRTRRARGRRSARGSCRRARAPRRTSAGRRSPRRASAAPRAGRRGPRGRRQSAPARGCRCAAGAVGSRRSRRTNSARRPRRVEVGARVRARRRRRRAPEIISAFHEVSRLSSRPGTHARSRAASSAALISASRGGSGVARTGMLAPSKLPASVTPKCSIALAELVAERVAHLSSVQT